MRKTPGLLLLLLLLPQLVFPQQKPLAITNVTVIDTTGRAVKRNMTVIITGERIAAIGKNKRVRIPKDAQVIAAAGKFLIPGLWDMHTHLGDDEFDRDSYLKLFVANGITGIRLMSDEAAHYLWRKEIESGALIGPRMIIGSFIDGPKMTAAEAREAVRREALQAATLNPAKFLNLLNSLGAIEEGKLADLVLLDANPLEDIHNTKKISAVIVSGRLLDRKSLNNMLVEIELAVKRK